MVEVSRREWLKRAGLAGVAVVGLPELSRVLLFRRGLLAVTQAQAGIVRQNPILADGGALTATELATLEAICARLVPTDELGPGATEARAARYIDNALDGALASYRDDYSVGLAAINVYARSKEPSARSFGDLGVNQQNAVLSEMEQDVELGFIPSSAAFFNLIRAHTLQGMFCDPIYGGNAGMVGWDLIAYPGVRLSVAASEQSMSAPAKANHKSAYDYVMFSKP
ncbi:MAG TPA: gluconate 2-dehydrogenase subunit 3 family protein [Vicinamibacterales bacterium]|jgi:gluconate 2-dehydrogenase gamma chain|nr:gluconate 2-dehydrogenase subunit 3 family protein [Vicinamibacterales bacterium]